MPTLCTSRFSFNKKRYSLSHYSDPVSRQVVREVMDGTSYPLYPFPKGRIRKILDLGAHVGAATIYFHCHYPTARITAVEPHPEYAKILRTNLAKNNVPAEFIEAAYVVNDDRENFRTLFMADGKHGPCSSYVTPFDDTASFEVNTLNQQTLFLQNYDLIKIDVEGGEEGIFCQLPRKMWEEVSMIYVEYHEANTRLWIDDALRATHILVHARIYHPSTGELAYVARRNIK